MLQYVLCAARHLGHAVQTELDSFLIEISALIFAKKDDKEGKDGWLLDQILDKTGMKGTGASAWYPTC